MLVYSVCLLWWVLFTALSCGAGYGARIRAVESVYELLPCIERAITLYTSSRYELHYYVVQDEW